MIRFSMVLLIFCAGIKLSAQTKTPPVLYLDEYPQPKVILMMLHQSTNKIEALKKRGLSEDVAEVIATDEQTNQSIISDFAANFDYCPVYFFYDSSIDLIKQKAWSDIIFYDYEKLEKKKLINVSGFTDYYIADVGYPSPSKQLEADNSVHPSMRDSYKGEEDVISLRNYGINLYDQQMIPLKGRMGFTDISLRNRGPVFGEKKMVFEGAVKFDKLLRKRFGEPAATNTK
jgi:hypothetical protein